MNDWEQFDRTFRQKKQLNKWLKKEKRNGNDEFHFEPASGAHGNHITLIPPNNRFNKTNAYGAEWHVWSFDNFNNKSKMFWDS